MNDMKNTMVTLLGGVEYEVKKLDGTTEKVKILQLPVSKMLKLLEAQDNEAAMVALFTGKPDNWCDTISNESFVHIVTEGEKVNADFFDAWVKRRIARQEKLIPGITEKLAQSAASRSLNTSPSLVSSVD